LPRRTDSNNPGDWLAIAESELEALRVLAEREISLDFRAKLEQVTRLLDTVRAFLVQLLQRHSNGRHLGYREASRGKMCACGKSAQ
jgi:hypothetical protein